MNGVPFLKEFQATAAVPEKALYRSIADDLGVDFLDSIDPSKLMVRDADLVGLLSRRPGAVPIGLRDKAHLNVIAATDGLDIPKLRRQLAKAPHLKERLRMAAPSTMRSALFERAAEMLAFRATGYLWEWGSEYSARLVLNAWQSFFFGVATVSFVLTLVLHTQTFLTSLHLLSSLFFLACISLRLAAISAVGTVAPFEAKPMAAEEMPVYTVLVALYKEAEVVPELLVSLGKLVWPRSKLEIKLVCEADDHDTIAAIRAQALRMSVEVIAVPRIGPRTKPKALTYALPTVTGEFIVLYDAEDRPHPLQLVEAWQKFRESGDDLACLQAPLEVSNGANSTISRLFAFEYATLFRGMLPWLASKQMLLPLGGTSNHFRRSILEHVGAWDPYNVTEDADLAVRFARLGYRTETITMPTYEDGPEDVATWLPQRTRWFKGWAQTWLVHMREPVRLWRELGAGSFGMTQLLFAGLLASSLVHPMLIVNAVWLTWALTTERITGTGQLILLGLDISSVLLGYLSFLLLGWSTQTTRERRSFWRVLLYTPPYWLMLSWAAWRALWQLIRDPHRWEKTRHRAHRRGMPARAMA
ncbi:glycosyltransferase [Mesorhizobium sp. NBSH29]|uniref:glycosyltransferase n=1 Tax=Mesorhizobium sp. NBSH29 TaxID=2654249 RepID=UPI00215637CC|nr:glycosyltransferase [Mesorhizobium sp. NBSH29]